MWITADYVGLLQFNWIYLDYSGCFDLLELFRFNNWVTADYSVYSGLYRVTPDYSDHLHYSDLLGLLRFTPDLFDLLRIIPDYQFGSPSGPADYQSCFPLEIIADYPRLLWLLALLWFTWVTPIYSGFIRFTLDYPGLPVYIAYYVGLHHFNWIYLDYSECFDFLGWLRFNCITTDYSDLLRIMSAYPGLLWLLALLWFTFVTPIYSGLLRITSDYSGLPVRITKWSSGLPELFSPRDYCGLLRITPDYPRFFGLLRFNLITPDLSDLLQITPDHFGLLWITPDHFGLQRITSFDHQVVQRITRVVSSSGLLRITPNYARLPQIIQINPV